MQDTEKITGDILRELEELNKLGESEKENAIVFTNGGGSYMTLCCC